jgi:hypothetical protein
MYYFVVSGLNAAGEGGNSVEVAARPVSSAPTSLSASVNTGQIQMIWPMDHTGWRLQAQTNSASVGLGTNWVTVDGSSATNQMSLPLNAGNDSVFFRLVYP